MTADDLQATGAMTALLKDAIKPNLIQTLEHTPALVHGGPFANIAHGCNSVRATKMALKLGDIAVTEAGFGADLGAEKFFDIKCRMAGLKPDAVVLVATVRALKYNGGVAKADLAEENLDALAKGIVNLEKHIENIQKYGVPVVVTLNSFVSDTDAENAFIEKFCHDHNCEFALSPDSVAAAVVLSVLEAAPLSVAASVLPVTSPVDGSAGLVGSVGVTGSVGLVGLTGFSGLVGSVGLSGVEGVLSSPLLSPLLPSS